MAFNVNFFLLLPVEIRNVTWNVIIINFYVKTQLAVSYIVFQGFCLTWFMSTFFLLPLCPPSPLLFLFFFFLFSFCAQNGRLIEMGKRGKAVY